MSRETIRAGLAALASDVDGIECTPYMRQSTKPGQAWIQWVRWDFEAFGGFDTWRVWVVLPQDYAAGEKRAEALIQPLIDSVGGRVPEAMSVRNAVVQNTVMSETGQAVPTLYIEGTRESE